MRQIYQTCSGNSKSSVLNRDVPTALNIDLEQYHKADNEVEARNEDGETVVVVCEPRHHTIRGRTDDRGHSDGGIQMP